MFLGERLLAREDSERNLFRFVDDRARVTAERTVEEQRARSLAIAAHLLLERGLPRQARVVLVYAPSLEFVDAYLGCVLAGLVAVPVMPPDPLGGDLSSLQRICDDCGAAAILSHTAYDRARTLGRLRSWSRLQRGPRWPELPWILTDRIRPGRPSWRPTPPAAEELVFLQYTSGTTGHPKGVRINHRNLDHQLHMQSEVLGFNPEARGAAWVPQYHDFGLICAISSGAWGNASVTLMSPLTFLRRPATWMEVLSRERTNYTCSPNFGLDFVVRKTTPEQRRRWDLSGLECLVNAAEPVRRETHQRFLEAFTPCGLRPEVLAPCYGLAEHVVGAVLWGRAEVCVDERALEVQGRITPVPAGSGRWLVGNGAPKAGVQVRVVDPETHRVRRPGEVGEVWIDSPSKGDGYEGQPELSRAVFAAETSPPDGRRYLRTGDLGALWEGELFITGRIKDLVIVRGRNVHPPDVEEAARQAHPALRPGGLAVFGVSGDDGSESLVAFAEVADGGGREQAAEVAAAVRAAVATVSGGLDLEVVVVGRRGLVLKTTSGKVRRGACRERYLAPDFARDPQVLLVSRRPAGAPARASELGEDGLDPAQPGVAGLHPAGLHPAELHPAELHSAGLHSAGLHSAGRHSARPGPAELGPAGSRATVGLVDLTRVAEGVLGRPLGAADVDVPLRELGFASLQLVDLCHHLEAALGVSVGPEQLFETPTLRALAEHLGGGGELGELQALGASEPVAIVGLACRFPGGIDDELALWEAFRAGRAPARADFGEAVEWIDPLPFGLGEREAARLAPEQRLALELAWEAFESAGLAPDRVRGLRCGVFLSASAVEYSLRSLYAGRPDAWCAVGAMPSVVAGRVSYTFGLRGPALMIDTACSSSLVAVHLAAEALRRGECDLALAGGLNVTLEPEVSDALRATGALSPSGRCWTFERRADGYARGDGAAVVVLRRAADAARRGDRVLCELRGSALNHDGRSNGLTAPNLAEQRAVIAEAWGRSGLLGQCGYVEAHGTGTPLGDAVELSGIAATLGALGAPEEPLWVGSAKGNLGHTETTAGVAGLLRAALAIERGEVPPQASFEEPTPGFAWEGSRLRVPRAPLPWPSPRVAGVSSFGLSGTNAHAVLAEAPAREPSSTLAAAPAAQALVLAGHHADAVAARAQAVAARLRAGACLRDLAASLNPVQADLRWRLGVVARDAEGAAAALEAAAPRDRGASPPRVAFVFPGQGTLGAGVVAALEAAHPELARLLGEGLEALAALDPAAVDALRSGDDAACQRTDRAQPGLLVIGWALARLWARWGVVPQVVAGHSAGELTAAVVAGALSFEDALLLATRRGSAMHRAPAGAMLAVRAGPEELGALPPGVEVAVRNGPRDLVLAGPAPAIEALERRLAAAGQATRPVAVPHAFHTAAMDEAAVEVAALAGELPGEPPRLRWLSSLDGRAIEGRPPAEHWGAQLRRPVEWEATSRALAAEVDVVLELGPGADLSLLGRRAHPGTSWVASAQGAATTLADLLEAAVAAHTLGLRLDWRALESAWPARSAPIPGPAWQRRRLWVERAAPRGADQAEERMPGRRAAVAGVGLVFELSFGPEAGWLDEHVVGGAPLLPAAFLLEWLAAVGRAALASEAVAVEDLALERPAPWSPDLRLQALVREGGDCELHASADGEAWVRCGRARLVAGGLSTEEPPPARPGDELRSDELCSDELRCDEAYAALAARGLRYGPTFQRVVRARRRAAGAVAELSPLAAPAGALLHPAVLDAALHPLAFALEQAVGGTWLPAGAARYQAARAPEGAVEVEVACTGLRAEEVRATITLRDARGVAARIEGLRATSLERGRASLSAWSWRPLATAAGGEAPAGEVGVVARDPAQGARAATALEAEGLAARAMDPSLEADAIPDTILLLIEDDPSAPLAGLELCRQVGRAALAASPPPRLVIATRAGVDTSGEEPLGAGAAAVWGLARSLRREQPELGWGLRDLDEPTGAALRAVLAAQAPELAWRRGALLEPELLPAAGAAPQLGPRAARVSDAGLLDEVRLRPLAAPRPGPGQVLIEVRAAGLNFRDVLVALGVVPGAPGGALGGECAGVILALGPGVDEQLEVGAPVVSLAAGALATHVLADAREVAPLPAGLGFAAAATLPIVFATAWHALVERADLRPGQRVLIHSAAGGVGLAALQIAQGLGAEVFATAHPDKWEFLRAQGVTRLATSRDPSFAQVFEAELGPRGLDVVLDATVGAMVDAGLGLLRPGGLFLEVGKRDVRDPAEVSARWGARYEAFDLAELGPAGRGQLLRGVLGRVAAGELRPLPRRLFALDRLPEALRYMAEARHRGKVVLRAAGARGGAALISGGLGALGQQTGAWLARARGVSRLVLLGRGAADEALGPELQELRRGGLELELVRGDVTSPADVAAALERCGPELRWVVHCAGVLDDGPGLRQSQARMQAVFAPKLRGAEVLDQATRGRELEGFVLFGSAAASFGPPGQAAYAAANAAMEAVAAARRARGEAAACVEWGPWSGPGMAASADARRAFARQGVTLLQPLDALTRLGDALAADLGTSLVLGQQRAVEVGAVARAARPTAPAAGTWLERVRAAVARVLSLAPEDVPPDEPLSALGVDSLSAIELRNELAEASGRQLPLSLADGDPTVAELASRIQP
ncbi:MAG: beta-ketoacyl synthase N-terminal-like domain-containing protein [Planctomycetota bacterium]